MFSDFSDLILVVCSHCSFCFIMSFNEDNLEVSFNARNPKVSQSLPRALCAWWVHLTLIWIDENSALAFISCLPRASKLARVRAQDFLSANVSMCTSLGMQ